MHSDSEKMQGGNQGEGDDRGGSDWGRGGRGWGQVQRCAASVGHGDVGSHIWERKDFEGVGICSERGWFQ